MSLMMLLVLAGCPSGDPTGDTAVPPRVELGQCDLDRDAANLGGYTLLYSGSHVWWGARELNYSEVLSNADEWTAFTLDLRLTAPAPSFPEQVAVAIWEPRERCELAFHAVEVYDLGEQLHVDAEFHDYEAGCDETCADPGGAIVIVSVSARANAPSVCRTTWDACALP